MRGFKVTDISDFMEWNNHFDMTPLNVLRSDTHLGMMLL
jgi:hypothetical protein